MLLGAAAGTALSGIVFNAKDSEASLLDDYTRRFLPIEYGTNPFGEDFDFFETHFDDMGIFGSGAGPFATNNVMSAYPSSAFLQEILGKFPIGIQAEYLFIQGTCPHEEAMKIAHNVQFRNKIVTRDFFKERFREFVRNTGVAVTHANWWGGYGHPQHILVCEALEEVCEEEEADLWVEGGIYSIHTPVGYAAELSTPRIMVRNQMHLFKDIRAALLWGEEEYKMRKSDTWWDKYFYTWHLAYEPLPYSPYYLAVKNGQRIYNVAEVRRIFEQVTNDYYGLRVSSRVVDYRRILP